MSKEVTSSQLSTPYRNERIRAAEALLEGKEEVVHTISKNRKNVVMEVVLRPDQLEKPKSKHPYRPPTESTNSDENWDDSDYNWGV